MAIAHTQSSPLGGGGCGAPGPEPAAVGLDLGRGQRDLLDLRRKGFLSAEQVTGMQRGFLLDAACEVVAEHGYRGLTVSRVMARAGISRITFYELFSGMDACLLAAVGRAHERVSKAAAVGYVGVAGHAWEHRVHGAVVEVLALFDAQPALAQLCVVHAPSGPSEVRIAHRDMLAGLARAFTQSAGELGKHVSPRVAEGAVGGAWAMLYQRLTASASESLLELAGEMSYLLCAPFLGPATVEALLHRGLVSPRRDWRAPTRASAEGVKWRAEVAGKGSRKQILWFIREHPGVSNLLVGEHLGTTPSTTSRRLAGMARDGLIHAESRGTHRAWHITPHGQTILAA